MAGPIYVELAIAAPRERLWELTQTPALHERWDLRFTSITYLPRPDEAQPQRFRYTTQLGFGLCIAGWGETVGEQRGDDVWTSALKFGSDDTKSLIREGSGYWQYRTTPDGQQQFLTQYDYRVRWGLLGRTADLVFRPLMGWATAWSFDRLRLWAERGVDPTLSAVRALVEALCRVALGLVWLYQGIVPKLLLGHPRELELMTAAGFAPAQAHTWLQVAGWCEVAAGLAVLLLGPRRSVFVASAVVAVAVTLPALRTSPGIFVEPFNPTTLVLAMLALSACGFVVCKDLPSARRCLQRKKEEKRAVNLRAGNGPGIR